MLE
ncbi:methyladenine glycosylase family protein, partial [Vibrio parahaemolyticus EKP-008]|jgi:hypothetical protein